MAGAAGTNIDVGGFILDPTLVEDQQYYKEIGANPQLTNCIQHAIGGYRTVKITTAQVLAMNTTPIQIVPAPGVGKILIPTVLVASMVYNSATYSTNSGGAALKYGTAGAGSSPGIVITQAFLQASSGTNLIVVRGAATAYLPATTDYNVPLTLIAVSSDPTTGDSDLYVRVYFQILTVPFAVGQSA